MEEQKNRTTGARAIDLSLLALVSFALCWAFYHPYYFGDELTAFFRDPANRGFLDVFGDLNSYKPRLVFNALWACYGTFSAPRYVPMIVNALCLGGAASILYLISRSRCGASRIASLLVAGVFLTSRFGLMLHFDYLSGNIETLGALLFFSALYFALGFVGGGSSRSPHFFLAVLLSCLTVLVHERYIAATFAMGGFIFMSAFKAKDMARARMVCGIIVALLPLLMFFYAGKLLSSLSISTGTAGRPVAIDTETVVIFLRYAANVLFGTNFGLSWFVGTLSIDHSPGIVLIPALAVALVCSWSFLLLSSGRGDSNWPRAALMLGLIVALIAIAALPGADKQESRWMFPVVGLLGLFAISIDRGKAANVLLATYLVTNAAYFLTGSYKGIFNVQASSEANQFGQAFSKLRWNGGVGVILDAPEPQASWWLGGDTILGNDASSGLVFCRINFGISSACVFPPASAAGDVGKFDFGFRLIPSSNANEGGPVYAYVDKATLVALGRRNATVAAAIGEDFSSRFASIKATPSIIGNCTEPGAKANVVVHWAVKDPSIDSVTVWLAANGSAPALFSVGGQTGVAETGKWVDSEISFVLTDSGTKRTLAVATVRNRICR